jgi:hypothetical protein
MATMVLHNFAGAGCNLVKYLTWTLLYSKEPSIGILFYYRNKKSIYDANDNPNVFYIQKMEDLVEKNIFYKFFEYPPGCSSDSFAKDAKFTLSFPSDIPIDNLPPCFANFPTILPTQVKDGKVSLSFGGYRSFYTDPLLPAIRQAYFEQIQTNLQFRPWLKEEIQKELQVIQDYQKNEKRILATFVRFSSHYKGPSFEVNDIVEEIGSHLQNYDYILVTTQVNPTFKLIKERFGDKVISFDRKRLEGDIDWEKNVSDEEFEEEVKMAIIDIYLMSQCDGILSGMSNMLLMAIFFNPTIPFTLFDTIKAENTG